MSVLSFSRPLRRMALSVLVVASASVVVGLAAAPGRAQPPTGFDVSNWQGRIDWVAVARAGQSFVFAKATEGVTFSDVTYPINRDGAATIGIRLGAYHYALPGGGSDPAAVASAIAQADHFVSFAQPHEGDLLPVLDLERTGGLTSARLTLWVQTFLDHVQARLGVAAIIYVSPSFWKERMADSSVLASRGHDLWIAHWTKDALPVLPGGGWGSRGWAFWQWTNCLPVTGISRCVDGNRFNGTDLGPVLVPPAPAGVPVAVSAPTITGIPQVGRLLAATAGAWDGGKPAAFTYQWERCTSAGTGCSPIAGASKETYTSTSADLGRRLRVAVSATAPGGVARAMTAPTATLAASTAAGGGSPGGAAPSGAPRATQRPTVSGLAQVGQELTGAPGRWTGAPTSFAYQWQRCTTASAATCETAADASIYTVAPGDSGAVIRLLVTATGRSGTGSAQSAPTGIVLAAPVPPAALGTAASQSAAAGAVTTAQATPIAAWQPGAVPVGQSVTLEPYAAALPQGGSAVALGTGGPAPLPWPIDVRYPSQAPGVIAGFIPESGGAWRPLAEVSDGRLPAGQETGTYRDPENGVHVLTRVGGRIALFRGGEWGDPRFSSIEAPRLATIAPPAVRRRADGTTLILTRLTIDAQVRLTATVSDPSGHRRTIDPSHSRIGWWLTGNPGTTVGATQLRPGAIPLRLSLPSVGPARAGRSTVRIVATDAYRRTTTLAFEIVLP